MSKLAHSSLVPLSALLAWCRVLHLDRSPNPVQ